MLDFLPRNISTFGPDIDHVISTIYIIVGIWFVLAEVVLFYFILSSRRKKGVKSSYIPANNFKTVLWVAVPVVIVFCFDIFLEHTQAKVWEEIKINRPANPDMVVGIKGQQFKWEFTLPGPDNKLGTDDDVTELNDLYVLVDKDIEFELTSKDVLHSFFVPNMKLKQDAVPGRNIKGWFHVTEKGTFPIACAELCGSGHGTMGGVLHVVDQDELNKYYASKAEEKNNW